MAMIILLVLCICLALLIYFLITCYSDYRQVKQDSEQFNRLMQDQLELGSNSMDAYEAMLREACRTLESDDSEDY